MKNESDIILTRYDFDMILTRHCNESQHSSHFLIRHSHPSLSSHRIMWRVRNPTEQNTTTKSTGKQNTNTPTSLVSDLLIHS